ncbi:uncharacterized protein LOC135471548 isoform X2 [Liolophura sinensis]|uniref:uncharacterized protein LOC135471548 isoform X2 n=1 Tax=Liolophura sinensis TaxID=3198878 RepID=UPI00315915ED
MFLFRMHCAILLFHRVNSVAKVERTVEEIKKKWSDLSSQVKRKEARRRADARKTGGGAPMEEPSDTELKMTVVKMSLLWVKAPIQHHLNQNHQPPPMHLKIMLSSLVKRHLLCKFCETS